jgi:tRNA-2-methylthio-N6-dimethylallyladenosine synthase
MPGKLFIKTFGCQMNEYDSAKMADVLAASHGLTATDDPAEAAVILVNTCSVRERAQEKVFSELGRWKPFKQANPSVVIGVGGCVASQEGEGLVKRAPFVDLVFGPQTIHRLPEMLDAALAQRRPVVDVSFPEIEKFDHLPPPRAEGPTAFVSIMEGCSKYCSFCVVPYTRGEEVSRPFDQVMREVEQLAAQGVREVTLLGQNVNGYRGNLGDGESADLALLLRAIDRIPGIERMRFTTSHPLEFGEALIRAFADLPKLANYLHLPVQSGSDRVLAAMKRGYTALEFKQKVRRLRALRPDISLSSDFIVGFPGETEAEFEQTMRLIDDLAIDQAFAFVYSRRPGTPAAALPDDTSDELKHARLVRLQDKVHGHGLAYGQRLVGSTQRVLVERHATRAPDGPATGARELAGRTECNRWVNFAGPESLLGRFADVVVTEIRPYSLRGRLPAAAAVA